MTYYSHHTRYARKTRYPDTFVVIRKKRSHFEEMKETTLFQSWKKLQYYCQKGRCAWCKKHIDYNYGFEVDHVKPLRFGGTDRYQNLVLACKDCNQKKYTSTHGYNSTMDPRLENEVPSWIEKNPITLRLEEREREKQASANVIVEDEELDLSEIPF